MFTFTWFAFGSVGCCGGLSNLSSDIYTLLSLVFKLYWLNLSQASLSFRYVGLRKRQVFGSPGCILFISLWSSRAVYPHTGHVQSFWLYLCFSWELTFPSGWVITIPSEVPRFDYWSKGNTPLEIFDLDKFETPPRSNLGYLKCFCDTLWHAFLVRVG